MFLLPASTYLQSAAVCELNPEVREFRSPIPCNIVGVAQQSSTWTDVAILHFFREAHKVPKSYMSTMDYLNSEFYFP